MADDFEVWELGTEGATLVSGTPAPRPEPVDDAPSGGPKADSLALKFKTVSLPARYATWCRCGTYVEVGSAIGKVFVEQYESRWLCLGCVRRELVNAVLTYGQHLDVMFKQWEDSPSQ